MPETESVLKKINNTINTNTNSTNSITIQKCPDLTQTTAKITSWSEFASWNQLENNCPYW